MNTVHCTSCNTQNAVTLNTAHVHARLCFTHRRSCARCYFEHTDLGKLLVIEVIAKDMFKKGV